MIFFSRFQFKNPGKFVAFFSLFSCLSFASLSLYAEKHPMYSFLETDHQPLDTERLYPAASGGDPFVMYLLSRYSPEGNYIIHKLKTMENLPYMKNGKIPDYWFSRGKTREGSLRSLQVIGHEGNHVITSHTAVYDKDTKKIDTSIESRSNVYWMAYYMGERKRIFVKKTKTFPSREIRKELPSFITKNSDSKKVVGPGKNYYEIYIYPSNINPSTQSSGIYGLVDEFNSYYHGKRVVLDMYRYCLKERPFPAAEKVWGVFLQENHSNYLAYFEFKLYILTYFLYAKENHPGVYKELIQNKPLIAAFLMADRNHKNLIKEFADLEKRVKEDVASMGIKVEEKGDNMLALGGEYVVHDLHAIKNYNQVLGSPAYKNMEKFLRKDLWKD